MKWDNHLFRLCSGLILVVSQTVMLMRNPTHIETECNRTTKRLTYIWQLPEHQDEILEWRLTRYVERKICKIRSYTAALLRCSYVFKLLEKTILTYTDYCFRGLLTSEVLFRNLKANLKIMLWFFKGKIIKLLQQN